MRHICICFVLFPVLFANLSGIAQDTLEVKPEVFEMAVNARKAYRQEEYKKAEKLYDQALEVDRYNAGLLFQRGEARIGNKDYMGALKDFSAAIELEPEVFHFRFQRGVFLGQLRRYDLAIEDYDVAYELANDDDSLKIRTLVRRASTYGQFQEFEAAYEDYMSILAIDSLSIEALNNISFTLVSLGRGEEGVPYLEKLYQVDSTLSFGIGNLGWYYISVEEYEKALIQYDKAIAIAPETGSYYNNRGYARFKLGDIEAGLADVQNGLELDPNNAYGYRNLAIIYLEMGKDKKACKALEMAVEKGFSQQFGNEVEKLRRRHCK